MHERDYVRSLELDVYRDLTCVCDFAFMCVCVCVCMQVQRDS